MPVTLASVRLTPLIPDGADPLNLFVVALHRIEQDQELVDGVFNEFLSWLAAP